MINFFIYFFKSLFGKKKTQVQVNTEVKEEINQVSTSVSIDTTPENKDDDNAVEADIISENDEKENKVSTTVEIKVKKVYIPFSDEDKEEIANLVRPIIKSFNDSNKYKVIEFLGENIKTFKNYMTLSDDKETIIIRLTQSNKYNINCVDFLLEIFKPMVIYVLNNLDANFEVEVNDNGYIEIHKYKEQ